MFLQTFESKEQRETKRLTLPKSKCDIQQFMVQTRRNSKYYNSLDNLHSATEDASRTRHRVIPRNFTSYTAKHRNQVTTRPRHYDEYSNSECVTMPRMHQWT